jgi:PHO85 cyclin-5
MPPAHPPARQPHSRISPCNIQLPSPISPTTQPSPFSPQPTSPQSSRLTTAEMCDPRNSFVPLRGFVHEVLRKSRTSGAVLQTALCYLEAIRTKIPDLVREEQCGEGVRGEKEPAGRIIKAEDYNEADESMDGFSALIGNGLLISSSREESAMDTGSLETLSNDVVVSQGLSTQSHRRKEPQAPLPPLPPLPSPLLCPKRAFLASLILASKFTQDRCYSNRAWAKLCSLPPREMGRCERALGEALQWRLWVGKKSTTPASPASTNGRSVVRCHSVDDLRREGELSPWPARDHTGAEPRWMGTAATHRGLGRSSSLPARAFCSAEISATGSNSTSTNCPTFDWAPTFWPTPNPAGLDPQMPPRSSWSSSLSNTHGYAGQTTPPTPTLSYSPASAGSTDSSGGDRTVQMDGIPTPPHFMSSAFGPYKTDLVEDFATGLPVATPYIVGQNLLPGGGCHILSRTSQKLGVMMVPNEGTFSGLDAFNSY